MPGRTGFQLWRAAAALVTAACVAGALYAASPLLQPADSDAATLRGLQIRVMNISQAAAENRMDGALAALEALEKDLNDAAGQGLISLSRYRGIDSAVEAVRADITRQLAAASAAAAETPAATPSDTSTAQAAVQPQQAPQVEPVQPAVVPAPVPAPVQQQPVLPGAAKEVKGKGKGAKP
ncbi:MAG: hypothetical protein JWQ56_1093 [Pseudarthrobacter sp.]|nr:hypothetical protein [Pseudarthrobacter sp.]